MRFYLIKTPRFLKWIFSQKIWEVKTKSKEVFLTFDDGPTPEVTDFVLNLLEKHQAKASFFCIGKNADQYPKIINRIDSNGHTIGNHTYNHYHCYKHSAKEYLGNIKLTTELLSSLSSNYKKLFRPPYGRLSPKVTKILKQQAYKIIMWDVLSADFDLNQSADQLVKNVINNVKPGSIVVFHDSVKSYPKLKKALPGILIHLENKGYSFSAL